MRWLSLLLLLVCSCGGARRSSAPSASEALAWNEWSPAAFERARREGKVVLLSVQAGWCHWCHVMNDTTFRDPDVRRALAERFVLIRADGDARPDLADRYRRYAWPATVFLHPEGGEILGLRGYRAPARFRVILREVELAAREGRTLVDQEPTERAGDLDDVRATLVAQLDRMYDEESGGWGRSQRYPFAAPVEHALLRAVVRDEAEWRARALATLERYATLIDPVWGGMYQYSEGGVWDRPHYEKIVPVQAGAIRAFAEAYRVSGDRRWLGYAEDVRRYVRAQLTAPDGAFFTSQDADLAEPHVPGPNYYARDDAGRRALGIPRIDRHVYASTNGMLIEALAELAVASGEEAPLREAIAAADRVLTTHRHSSGLFVHDAEAEPSLLHLADQARMLAALLALHEASADRRWLDEASRLADALAALRDPESGGFFAHTADPDAVGVFRERLIPIADNAITARALMALARLSDRDDLHEAALASLRACARPAELRALGRMIGEYLIALELAASSHVLFSVVGPDEPRTRALHSAALRYVDPTRLVELSRPGASRYPYPDEPAVFLCTRTACSMPVTDPLALAPAARAFLDRR
jgi:uncharacterized protein YyaL (SSP411 family)